MEDGVIPNSVLPSCEHVRCSLVLERPCPADSISVGGTVPLGECCPEPFHCECMPCTDSGPACGPDQLRVLSELGVGQPGQCCDIYKCENKDDICRDVVCEVDPFANATCPEDSVPLSPLITQNGCCTQHAGCICAPPDFCDIPHCDPGTRPQLVRPRTGLPGRCCDVIKCVSDSIVQCLTSDGVWREDGEHWLLDECTECECHGGLTQCNRVQCELIESCGWISIPKGECCHKCIEDSPDRPVQADWEATWTQKKKLIFLADLLRCCTKGNMTYVNGAEWKQDDCVTCYCESGQVYCRAELCLVHCENPRTVPGQCCPVCDGTRFVSKCEIEMMWAFLWTEAVSYGHLPTCMDESATINLPSGCPNMDNCTVAPFCPLGLEVDETGCYICQCKDDVVIGAIPELCSLDCPLGYVVDDDGLEMCQCLTTSPPTTTTATISPAEHDSRSLMPPTLDISPPDDRLEPDQQETINKYFCPPIHMCTKECVFGYRISKDGCPKCKCNRCPPFICQKKCIHGYAYSDNGCVLCKCKDNKTQQPDNGIAVTSKPTSRPLVSGTCLTDDGHLWDEGESWHDGCRLCFCHQAQEMCTLITCPVPRCRHPVVIPGDCCGTCHDETAIDTPSKSTSCHAGGGQHIAEGETWKMDGCTLCICLNGDILCEAERCPPLTCHHPVILPNHCCPLCIEDDELPVPSLPNKTPGSQCQVTPGMVFHSGDIWRVSACQSCMCRDGQIHCYSQTCPLLTKCNKTIMRKGQCCPQCIEEELSPMTCALSGETYASGEMWLLNNCTWCICHDGRILCLETQCSPLINCLESIILPDTCCPICINQTIPLNEHNNGSRTGRNHYAVFLTTIIVLLVVVILLTTIVVVLCWRRRRHKRQERDRRAKAMQALFEKDQPQVNISKRPKSVNLEYRGGNHLYMDRLNKLDYRKPQDNKFCIYDETEGLLTSKSKCSDTESGIIRPGADDTLSKEKDALIQAKPINNLNEFHASSLEDNYNITCGSNHTLTKPYSESSNDLTDDMDKLSEFDNAACISSSCSDVAVNHASHPSSMCASKANELSNAPSSPASRIIETNGLEDDGDSGGAILPNVTNIPTRGHQPADKHMRYSVNDEVWLRNSSRQGDKAPMGDKCIRYSVGADNGTGAEEPVLLGVPSVCDSASYRKSL
ncbi:hypothetical protein LSH36_56g07015 [Paralvinella palmiformis]|uniref:Cysteine-rich motor neuron 1 protein n=1 Tax=Paralvinella palmiformis TaxID=53620 RepID=A0AAD9NF85_9ANNE|nr:hypothetical protein LSH36_56g07015 [Paralvinella palmiformis]